MIDGTYKIKIDVPFGRKDGTIALRTEGASLFADIDAPLIGEARVQGIANGNTFTAEGSGKVKLVGKVDYTIAGEVSGNELHLDIHTNKGDFKFEGVRIQPS